MHFERTSSEPIRFKKCPSDPILIALRVIGLAIIPAIVVTKLLKWW